MLKQAMASAGSLNKHRELFCGYLPNLERWAKLEWLLVRLSSSYSRLCSNKRYENSKMLIYFCHFVSHVQLRKNKRKPRAKT